MIWLYITLATCDVGTAIWAYFDFAHASNFFADAIGTTFTIVVLNRLNHRAEQRRMAPIHRVVGKDIAKILQISRGLVLHVLQCVVKIDELPVKLEGAKRRELFDRFSAKTFVPVMWAAPGEAMRRPFWHEYLPYECGRLNEEINRFIERYVMFAEPAVTEAVQRLQETQLLRIVRDMPAILSLAQNGQFPSVFEDFIEHAIQLRAAVGKVSNQTDNFPDFGASLVQELEEHVRLHPYSENFFEYRPSQPSPL